VKKNNAVFEEVSSADGGGFFNVRTKPERLRSG